MLSLTKSPVDSFAWGDHIYKLDLAFDTVLLWQQMEQDDSLDDLDKWEQSLKLFFGKQKLPQDPDFYTAAFKLINKVITAEPYGNADDAKQDNVDKQLPPYDYVRDAGAIYASFYSQYGIDLNKERGKMHWTIFKTLLDGLGPKTYLQRIIQIRQENPGKIKDPSDRNDLLKAQNYYAVDGAKSEKELERESTSSTAVNDLFNALYREAKGGGK